MLILIFYWNNAELTFADVLDREQYKHFLYLHAAIRYLSSESTYLTKNAKAKEYLRYFVFRFTQIYGVNHCIYNLHSLIHLADDCLTHGPLEAFSAFPFETYLGWLTMLVRTPFNPMAQLVNRITEMNQSEDEREEIPNIDSTLSQCSKSNDLLYCNLKVLNQIHFYSCVSWNREGFILLNSKWNGS